MRLVAVIGSGAAGPDLARHAEDVGRIIAERGFGVVCGGLGGVMEAACRGARSAGGPPTVGLLPGTDPAAANEHVDIAIPTGLERARNVLVVLAGEAVVAVGGESGTLSEIAHAWQAGKPICAYAPAGGWGARLAGEALDAKRAGTVASAATPEELADWLRRTVSC